MYSGVRTVLGSLTVSIDMVQCLLYVIPRGVFNGPFSGDFVFELTLQIYKKQIEKSNFS